LTGYARCASEEARITSVHLFPKEHAYGARVLSRTLLSQSLLPWFSNSLFAAIRPLRSLQNYQLVSRLSTGSRNLFSISRRPGGSAASIAKGHKYMRQAHLCQHPTSTVFSNSRSAIERSASAETDRASFLRR
jgi:hypothetical protein